VISVEERESSLLILFKVARFSKCIGKPG
jgi:hypothetical protein